MSMTVATDRSLIDEVVARIRYRAQVLRSTARGELALELDDAAEDILADYADGNTDQLDLECLAAVMGVTRVAEA